MINVKQLQQVVTLFEVGTVTGAAERLHISQPALTAHLSRLESKLGETLFVRSVKGLEPTPMGKAFYHRAKEMLQHWVAFDSEISLLAGAEVGEIRVACGAVIEQEILPAAIIAFFQQHPQVSLQVDVYNPQRMLERLQSGEVDVAIGAFNSELAIDVEQLNAAAQQVGFFVRPDHPLLAGGQTLADFNHFSLASPQIPSGINQWMAEQGFSGKQRHLASDNYQLLKQVAKNSDLLVGGPQFVFTEELASGQLVKLPIKQPPLWQASLLIARPATHSKVVRSFVDCVLQAMPTETAT